MKPNSLSIGIPYYRGKELLAQAIESVRKQTSGDWTLVICDDNPQADGAEELVASFGDPRIAYCRNSVPLGMAPNWNRCLASAATDLVTILHADDELLEGYCELMLAAAQQHPEAVGYFCEARIVDQGGRSVFSLPDFVKRFLRPGSAHPLELSGREAVLRLLQGNFIVCPTMCFRRDRLQGREFDCRWKFLPDLALSIRLLLEGETLVGFPDVAYVYRRHASSATAEQTRSLSRFTEELAYYDELIPLAQARGWSDVARVARTKRIIWLNLAYCLLKDALCFDLSGVTTKWGLLRNFGRPSPRSMPNLSVTDQATKC